MTRNFVTARMLSVIVLTALNLPAPTMAQKLTVRWSAVH
jgi:hypothetical protein